MGTHVQPAYVEQLFGGMGTGVGWGKPERGRGKGPLRVCLCSVGTSGVSHFLSTIKVNELLLCLLCVVPLSRSSNETLFVSPKISANISFHAITLSSERRLILSLNTLSLS